MSELNQTHSSLYSATLLAFASVGVRYCSLIEQAGKGSLAELIEQLCGVVPALYVALRNLRRDQAGQESVFAPTDPPVYVTAATYAALQHTLEDLFGSYDTFIEIDKQDEWGETTNTLRMSELLCDIYQPVGDLLGILRDENIVALGPATERCAEQFDLYLGANCLSAARVLHSLDYNPELHQSQDAENSPTLRAASPDDLFSSIL